MTIAITDRFAPSAANFALLNLVDLWTADAQLKTLAADEFTLDADKAAYVVAAQSASADDLDGIEGHGGFGRLVILRADTGDTITIKDENAGASAADRIRTAGGSDVVIVEDEAAFLWYDAVLARWVVLSPAGGGAGHTEDHDHDGAPTQTLLAANTHNSPSTDTHHVEDHDHDGAPTQTLLAANSHGSPATDTHHAQSHTLASHSAKAHADLSDAPADAHHTEAHAPESHTGTDITAAELEDLSDGGASTLHSHAGAGSSSIGDADADTLFETERVADDDVARVKAEGVDVMEFIKHAATGLGHAKALALFAFNASTNLTLDGSGLITVTQSDHFLVSNSGPADDLEGLNLGIGSGTWLRLTAVTGDKITLKHIGAATGRFLLRDGKDVILDGDENDTILFIGVGSSFLLEVSRNIADEGASKIFQFPAHDEDLAVGVMGARPGTNTGEAGEHGDYTLLRATAIAGTVGSGAGPTTILIEVDDNPAFSSATTLFTITLTAATEAVDETAAAWTATDIFMRARCTAIEAVAPKDVNVMVMAKERLFNG